MVRGEYGDFGAWLGLMEVPGREVSGFGVWQSLRKKV